MTPMSSFHRVGWTLALSVLVSPLAFAATLTWEGDETASWATGGNWSTGYAPGATTADAVIFSGTPSANQPTLTANAPAGSGSITSLQFDTAGWTISGAYLLTLTSSGNVISSSGSGTNTISSNLSFGASSQSVSVASGNTLVTSGTISSGDNTTKTGAGTWRIQGSITSPFTATGGVVELNRTGGAAIDNNAPIRSSGSSTVIRWLQSNQVNSGAYLRVDTSGTMDLNGFNQTALFVQAGQAVNNAAGTISTGAGKLTLTNTSTSGVVRYAFDPPSFQTGRNGTFTLSGNVELNGTEVKYWNIGDGTSTDVEVRADAVISGTGGLVLQGTGTVELNASNTYSGNTVVDKSTINSTTYNAGVLIVNGGATSTSSGTGTGTVNVGATGTLAGVGTIGQTGRTGTTLTVKGTDASNLAYLSPGNHTVANTVGKLSVNGNISLDTYSQVKLELKSAGVSDSLAASGALSISGTGSVLRISLLGGQSLSGDYLLASYSAITGTFSAVYYNDILISTPTAEGAIGGTHQLIYGSTGLILAVPEPHSVLLLAAGLFIICIRLRRFCR